MFFIKDRDRYRLSSRTYAVLLIGWRKLGLSRWIRGHISRIMLDVLLLVMGMLNRVGVLVLFDKWDLAISIVGVVREDIVWAVLAWFANVSAIPAQGPILSAFTPTIKTGAGSVEFERTIWRRDIGEKDTLLFSALLFRNREHEWGQNPFVFLMLFTDFSKLYVKFPIELFLIFPNVPFLELLFEGVRAAAFLARSFRSFGDGVWIYVELLAKLSRLIGLAGCIEVVIVL